MQCTGNLGCFPRCPVFVFFSCVVFSHFVIHQTLTWTTGSLMCVPSYACIYTQGWGTLTTSQHNIYTWKNFEIFSCAPDGISTSGHGIHWILRPTLYQLNHHIPLLFSLTLILTSVRDPQTTEGFVGTECLRDHQEYNKLQPSHQNSLTQSNPNSNPN